MENQKLDSDCSSNSDEAISPSKRPRMDKTPVTLLTELCTQKKAGVTFGDVDISSIPQDSIEPHIKFVIECRAFNKSCIGCGATKKAAKHAAAQRMLREIEQDDEDMDMEPSMMLGSSDFVTELLNFCVQKNYHKPEFIDLDSYGPSHAPTFIAECRIDSIACRASASTKQIAKQQAARNVLEIFKASYPNMEKKVAIINERNNDIEDEIRRKITTYMDLKKREKTDLMGTTIANRHNFFLNYKNEEVSKELKQVLSANVSDEEKYSNLLKVLQKEWGYSITTFEEGTNLKCFELHVDFDQFSCMLVKDEKHLMNEILDYFTYMLEVNPPAPVETKKYVHRVDLTMTPL